MLNIINNTGTYSNVKKSMEISVSRLEGYMKSRLLVVFLLIFTSRLFAADMPNQVLGKWICEPFEDIISG